MAEFESVPINWAETELYEKQRARAIRKRVLLISLTILIFFALTSVPVVQTRYPAWKTYEAARKIASRIEQMKVDAISKRKAILFEWDKTGTQIAESYAKSCVEPVKEPRETWSITADESFKILSLEEAKTLEIQNQVERLCFDPLNGFSDGPVSAIAISPVNDLAESRRDRISYVIIDANTAKVSFQ